MYPLPETATCKHTTSNFKENLSKLINDYEVKTKYDENLEYDGNHFFLTRPLLMSLSSPLIWGTILKLVSQCFSISLPFFLSTFIKLIKTSGEFDYLRAVEICFLVLFLSIISGICQEHSNKYVSTIKSTGGQILRTLFIEKILCSNEAFLEMNDSSFVTKILLFEINPVVRFIGSIPSLIVAPLSIMFSFFMLYYNLDVGA